ncbi:MAG: hypothetical protein JJE25_14195 [Bacteroidia bacterium]|nr:hypothetical protein [Bacteroidia bacterium]
MKTILKYFFLLVIACIAKPSFVLAQNLVTNPSFEDTVACPFGASQLNFATGWSSYWGTPDYFNLCGTGNGMSSFLLTEK